MSTPRRILPSPDYKPRATTARIMPRSDYRPSVTFHSRALPLGSKVSSVEAEWCPVCLGHRISERIEGGKPLWHCEDCNNEW